VISRGEQTLPEAELLAEEQAICALPHRRAFNERKCEAFARAACDGTSCRFEGYGNCSGLLLQRGVFVTAAHCTDALMSSPETLAASRVVFFERQPGGWHQTEHALGSITPLKHVGEAWLTTADGRADVAVVGFSDPGEPLPPIEVGAVPEVGEPIWMLGFPRARDRSPEAMAAAGYGVVHGEPSVSIGRVLDPNRDGAPLCSPTGRQDDWAPRSPCPRGIGHGEDGEPTPTGPVTAAPFLSNVDTMNGYSGAPVFDAEGRWIGINSTVYGADPRSAYLP